ALQVVRPAVDRADDVPRIALAAQHDRLAVPADVRQELDTLRVTDERLRVAAAGQRVVVARFGHHQFVADIAGRAGQQQPPFRFEYARIGVPGRGKLRRS